MIWSVLDVPRAFLHYFQVFRGKTGDRIFLLIVLTAMMSYAEGIGIALFFPLLAAGQHGQDPNASFIGPVLRFLNITPTPLGVLPFIVLAFALKGVLQFCTITYQFYLHSQITRFLRRHIVAGLCRINYREIVGASAGHHSNLLVSAVERFGDAFINFVRTIPAVVNVGVFSGIVLIFDWRLSLVFGVLGLCSIFLLQAAGTVVARYSKAAMSEFGSLASLLIQLVQAFKYLRTRGGFNAFGGKVEISADRLAHAQFRTAVANALTQSLSQPLAVTIVAAIMYYLIAIRDEQIGSLLIVLAYFFRMISDLWTIQVNWQAFYSNIGSVSLVEAELGRLCQNAEPNGARPYAGFRDRISIRNVTFGYTESNPVLRNVSLEIEHHSTVAFVGESGSGKSTLVDLITGTLKPDAGVVTVDNVSLVEMNLETMRPRIGYVPQDAVLFDDNVANNITLWMPAGESELREAARQAECLEFIEAMPQKFATQVGDRGAKLSGGQRQRLAIARELFRQPDILVLDEATSSLDSESEREIQRSIDALKGRMTILVVAHRLSTVRNCDRIFVLEGGDIVESGTFAQLISKLGSRFRRMCELQDMT
jgi:ABC-type multidrug transport system fused ATPase/permease subunit